MAYAFKDNLDKFSLFSLVYATYFVKWPTKIENRDVPGGGVQYFSICNYGPTLFDAVFKQ